MKTKIATICVAVLLASVGLASFAMASDVVEVTGTFTASGTLSISVNNTSPDFGTITPGENEVVWFNVSNIGDIPVTVTQKQANKDSGDLTIGTVSGGLSTNEYSVEIQIGGEGDWFCIGGAEKEINASIEAEGIINYALRVTVSSSITYEASEEQFSADVEATETS
jgi:hypothetical protein